jgi:hypothetical protein
VESVNRVPIKVKVVLVLVVVFTLVTVAVLSLQQWQYEQNVADVSQESLRTSVGAFGSLEDSYVKAMSMQIEWIVTDPDYKLYMMKDRAKLQAWGKPIFDQFKKQYGITNWNNMAADRTMFFRFTEPENFGDEVTRYDVKKSLETKDWASGLDLGNQGYALRVAYPIYDKAEPGDLKNGELFGMIEVGMQTGKFLESVKAQTGDEYGWVIKKEFLDATKWANTRKDEGKPDNWNDQKDIVVAQNTTKDEAILRYSGDVAQLPDEGMVLEVVENGGRTYMRSVFPVKDAAGEKASAVFVLRDVTPLLAQMRQAQLSALGVIVALMLVALVVAVVVLNTLVFTRLKKMIETMESLSTRVAGGDYALSDMAAPKGDDEIARFENFFYKFLKLMSSTLQSLSEPQK